MSTTMSTTEARALVTAAIDAMNARDLDRLDDLIAPDFVRHCQATAGLEVNSLEDYKGFLRADAAAFPDNVQTLTHVAADGDLVGIWVTYEGTHLGPFGPVEPTGKRVSFDFAGMFRIAGGKLSEGWVVWDQMTILGQLGLLPAAEGAAS